MHSLAAKYDKTLARLAEDHKAVTAEEAERDAEEAAVADSRAQASQAEAATKTQQSKFDEQVRLFVTCTNVRKVTTLQFGLVQRSLMLCQCRCSAAAHLEACVQIASNTGLFLNLFEFLMHIPSFRWCCRGVKVDRHHCRSRLQHPLRDPLLDLLNCSCYTGRYSSNNSMLHAEPSSCHLFCTVTGLHDNCSNLSLAVSITCGYRAV